MKLIVVGNKTCRELSTELAYAQAQMRRNLPPGVPCVNVAASNASDLIRRARECADEAGIADNDSVLLLRHSFFWWPSPTLRRLAEACHGGASAALAYDSTHPRAEHPPDYFTIRGIERYAETCSSEAPEAYVPGNHFPALALTTAGHLRHDRCRENAVFVPGAYAHDFSGYHGGCREEIVPLIPASTRRILDVGGGEGGFLNLLKLKLSCETHLSEYSATACEVARSRVDKIWPGDFLRTAFDEKYDCITLLDVLEHTTWPSHWLKKSAGLLRPGGCIVASIPNVGHWSVLSDLLEGRWDYAAAGIHCITHLRFFTRRGIEDLMDEAGLAISEIRCNRIEPPRWFDVSPLGGALHLDLDNLATYAFFVVAKPKP